MRAVLHFIRHAWMIQAHDSVAVLLLLRSFCLFQLLTDILIELSEDSLRAGLIKQICHQRYLLIAETFIKLVRQGDSI